MTSKFNKEMYKKIKEKKNEPLSNIGQRKLRFMDKEKEREREKEIVERGSSTPALELEEGQAASPSVSIEEVARPLKKQKVGSKGKEKIGSSVWSDVEAAMDRANELLTPREMKEISSIPSHKMVSHHVHKLVQVILFILVHSLFLFILNHLAAFFDFDKVFRCKVLGETMHITTQYLANKERAVVANSKVEALEAEASGLWKDLVAAMDALNTSKEQAKVLTEQLESEKQSVKQKDDLIASAAQRVKIAVAKALTAFQTTEEYNTIMFQWYFKGFELLRRYMIKHGTGTNLENLDFEVVDKEIEEDEATQAST